MKKPIERFELSLENGLNSGIIFEDTDGATSSHEQRCNGLIVDLHLRRGDRSQIEKLVSARKITITFEA